MDGFAVEQHVEQILNAALQAVGVDDVAHILTGVAVALHSEQHPSGMRRRRCTCRTRGRSRGRGRGPCRRHLPCGHVLVEAAGESLLSVEPLPAEDDFRGLRAILRIRLSKSSCVPAIILHRQEPPDRPDLRPQGLGLRRVWAVVLVVPKAVEIEEEFVLEAFLSVS